MLVRRRQQALIKMDEERARRHRDVLQRTRRRRLQVQRPVGLNRGTRMPMPPPAVPIQLTPETPLFPPLLESIVSERIETDDEDTSLVSRLQKKQLKPKQNLALRATLTNHIQERQKMENQLQRARRQRVGASMLITLVRGRVQLVCDAYEEIVSVYLSTRGDVFH